MSEPKLLKKLSLFDVTNLVVGAIIGADIYVASSFGAGLLGPFSIFVWVIAGVGLIIIGIIIYSKFSEKSEIKELKIKLISSERALKRIYFQERRFLANILRLIKRGYRRIRRGKNVWEE